MSLYISIKEFEQHDPTFKFEIEELKHWSKEEEIFISPEHLEKMWHLCQEIFSILDRLQESGTSSTELTLAVIRLRSSIFTIPQDLNLDYRAKRSKDEH